MYVNAAGGYRCLYLRYIGVGRVLIIIRASALVIAFLDNSTFCLKECIIIWVGTYYYCCYVLARQKSHPFITKMADMYD